MKKEKNKKIKTAIKQSLNGFLIYWFLPIN